jgi:spermidine/putrescine transport system substrate-binding protein
MSEKQHLEPGLLRSPLTRRDLLRRAGLVGVSVGIAPWLLAACGNDTDDGASPTPGEQPDGDISGDINYISWQGYDLQDSEDVMAWQQENGITFNPTFINTHDDIQARVPQAPGTYNLTAYYQGYWQLYRDLDVVSPLDRDLVPNYTSNFPVFQGANWWEADGDLYGVPFTWGSWVMVYNPDEMPEPTSYQDLLSPDLRNRIAILDDPNGAILVGALVLGYEPPNFTQDQLDSIIDFFRDVRENSRLIAPSMGDVATLFASGEVIACVNAVNTLEGLIKQQGANAAAVIPQEGSATYCDAFAIPPESEDRDTAHAWINNALTPEVQGWTGNYLAQGITRPEAVDLLDEGVRELFPYDDLEGWLAQAPMYSLPDEGDPDIVNFQGWLNAWAAFTAEG